MEIFERASRGRIRFGSTMGDLSTEDLWDLPLTTRGERSDLDKLARAVHSELKSIEEGSFVNLKPDPRKSLLELKLEILKHVIAAKMADIAAAEDEAKKADRKRKLLAALANKEESELAGKSREEIEAEINALSV